MGVFLSKDMVANGLELVKPCEIRKWNTQFHRKVSNGKKETSFSEVPFFPEIFQWNEPKKHVPFTTQPEFPESLGKWKTPNVSMVFLPAIRITAVSLTSLQCLVHPLRRVTFAADNTIE